jgi:hypothetical protein
VLKKIKTRIGHKAVCRTAELSTAAVAAIVGKISSAHKSCMPVSSFRSSKEPLLVASSPRIEFQNGG